MNNGGSLWYNLIMNTVQLAKLNALPLPALRKIVDDVFDAVEQGNRFGSASDVANACERALRQFGLDASGDAAEDDEHIEDGV